MRQVSLCEINQHLSQYINELEKDGEIIITRRGKPVARLLPMAQKRKLSAKQEKTWSRLLTHLQKGYHLGGQKFNRDQAQER